VGRPNVGKSSLLNALLGEERTIVSATPGTTRDAIDTTIAWGRSEIVLIDTAGIKRRGKVASGPAAEKYSTMRSLKAITRADVAVLVLDAADGLTAQDAHVEGPGHRGQQVGHRRGQDPQDLRRIRGHAPPRARLH
jgi:GTPase